MYVYQPWKEITAKDYKALYYLLRQQRRQGDSCMCSMSKLRPSCVSGSLAAAPQTDTIENSLFQLSQHHHTLHTLCQHADSFEQNQETQGSCQRRTWTRWKTSQASRWCTQTIQLPCNYLNTDVPSAVLPEVNTTTEPTWTNTILVTSEK